MTETIDPKDIRVGDRVMRPATVSGVMNNMVELSYDGAPYNFWLDRDNLGTATITRPVDPDILLVRREMVKACPHLGSDRFAPEELDAYPAFKAALAAVKAVRAEIG